MPTNFQHQSTKNYGRDVELQHVGDEYGEDNERLYEDVDSEKNGQEYSIVLIKTESMLKSKFAFGQAMY